MTSAVSVGVGLVGSLSGASLDDRAPAMAQEFYKKHGPGAHISAFTDFSRANQLSNEEAKRAQDILVNRLGLYGLAGQTLQTQEGLTEKKKKAKEKKKHLSRGEESDKSIEKPKGGTGVTVKIRTHGRKDEGLGFSPDADGRGGGVSGGSPASEYGRYGAGFVSPNQAAQKKASGQARNAARKLYKRNSSWGGPLGSQASQGAGGVGNKGTVGGIRVPGGPIDTNEGGLVRVKILSHSLVELNIGGTSTLHSWIVFPEAIRHRLSDLGKATSSTWLPKVLYWAHNESMPGDEVIVDVVSGAHFVNRKTGFANLDRNWGTSG